MLNRHMVATNSIRNVDEPSPNIIDLIESGKIDYVVATSVKGRHPELGSVHIRRTAVERAIPCLTSMVIELGVDLLQGYFLAKPAASPSEIAPQALSVIRWMNR